MSMGPAVGSTGAAVYVIPTDAPEADGALGWNQTTMVLVTARAAGELGIGWTYAAAASASVVDDVLASVVVGRRVLDLAGAAEAMARAVRNIGRAAIAAMAISGVQGDRIPRVKIKIGESWGGSERRDLRRVALAREVIGLTRNCST
jgi:hypothetical protein